MTGEDNPQGMPNGGNGFGGFGGGMGINIEDIMRQFGGGFGEPRGFGGGSRFAGQQQGRQQQGRRTYTFTMGGAPGGGGMRF